MYFCINWQQYKKDFLKLQDLLISDFLIITRCLAIEYGQFYTNTSKTKQFKTLDILKSIIKSIVSISCHLKLRSRIFMTRNCHGNYVDQTVYVIYDDIRLFVTVIKRIKRIKCRRLFKNRNQENIEHKCY